MRKTVQPMPLWSAWNILYGPDDPDREILVKRGNSGPPGDVKQCDSPKQGNSKKSYFWSPSEGIYFTYTTQEIKISMCRALVQTLVVVFFFLVYFLAWGVCDLCILLATIGSCAGSCARIDWLAPSCWAGFLASLLRGYRIGSSIAHVDVKWQI